MTTDVSNLSWQQIAVRMLRAYADELVELESRLLIISRIDGFPFTVLNIRNGLWRQVRDALYESAVLSAARLLFDNDKRTLSIARFVDYVEANGDIFPEDVRAKTRKIYEENMIRVQPEFDTLSVTLRTIRDKFLAHLERAHVISEAFDPDQLKALMDCVGFAYKFYEGFAQALMESNQWIFDRRIRLEATQDIDLVLLQVASQSEVIYLPETNPAKWDALILELPPDELNYILYARQKLLLPTIKNTT